MSRAAVLAQPRCPGTAGHVCHPERGSALAAPMPLGCDGVVQFRIVAFSRFNLWAARVARPLVRRLQLRALRGYLTAVQRSVND